VLLHAAKEGNIEAVKQHLTNGADVNAKDKFGRTPQYARGLAQENQTLTLSAKTVARRKPSRRLKGN